jgi:hypothetical protein
VSNVSKQNEILVTLSHVHVYIVEIAPQDQQGDLGSVNQVLEIIIFDIYTTLCLLNWIIVWYCFMLENQLQILLYSKTH